MPPLRENTDPNINIMNMVLESVRDFRAETRLELGHINRTLTQVQIKLGKVQEKSKFWPALWGGIGGALIIAGYIGLQNLK